MNNIYESGQFNGIFFGYALKPYVKYRLFDFQALTRQYRNHKDKRRLALWIKTVLYEKPVKRDL
jgi:hypothetical protein